MGGEDGDAIVADIVAGFAPANAGSTGYVYPILAPLLLGATSVLLELWAARPARAHSSRHDDAGPASRGKPRSAGAATASRSGFP